ncbi:hypothetical protein KIPB_012922, partial [Kipferlia bialata]
DIIQRINLEITDANELAEAKARILRLEASVEEGAKLNSAFKEWLDKFKDLEEKYTKLDREH